MTLFNTKISLASRSIITAVVVLSQFNNAQAETTNCTAITYVPYEISSQGVYCLTGNLSSPMTSGYLIKISTNNVTIDLNGYKMGGLAAGYATQAVGIESFGRKNITIRNGIIRGFQYGISLEDTTYYENGGHLVEDILADSNTTVGIRVDGPSTTVRNNRVIATGLGSIDETSSRGISLHGGAGSQISGNFISNTSAPGASGSAYGAVGIRSSKGPGAVFKNNTISTTSSLGSYRSRAMWITFSDPVVVANNIMLDSQYGVYFSHASEGKYMNNVTTNITTPYVGGTATGSNY